MKTWDLLSLSHRRLALPLGGSSNPYVEPAPPRALALWIREVYVKGECSTKESTAEESQQGVMPVT